jgi:hypothetical protein
VILHELGVKNITTLLYYRKCAGTMTGLRYYCEECESQSVEERIENDGGVYLYCHKCGSWDA